MQGYCVRCKQKQEMRSPTRTVTQNGRRAMLGVCACCGTRMSVMGRWDNDRAADAPQAQQAQFDTRGQTG